MAIESISTTLLLFLLRLLLLLLLYGFLGILAWLVWRDLKRGSAVTQEATREPQGIQLTVVESGDSGYAEGHQFSLQTVNTIGRDLSNDIIISDTYTSTRHARIDRQGDGRFWLVDLDSRNGTLLNGQLVRPNVPVPLDPGDVIRIGTVELKMA
ncbi:MAG: FHA domain-containing protein [Chloroflexota bacterium]|nr:FHA domain-containing protein [Chloroflexota bacterium]